MWKYGRHPIFDRQMRRGKEIERKKKPQRKNIMACPIPQAVIIITQRYLLFLISIHTVNCKTIFSAEYYSVYLLFSFAKSFFVIGVLLLFSPYSSQLMLWNSFNTSSIHTTRSLNKEQSPSISNYGWLPNRCRRNFDSKVPKMRTKRLSNMDLSAVQELHSYRSILFTS